MDWKRLLSNSHPLCFAELPVFLFYNLTESSVAPIESISEPALLVAAVTIVLVGTLTLLWKGNLEKASLTVSIFWCFFFTMTYLYLLALGLERIGIRLHSAIPIIVLLGWILLAFVQGVVVITKKNLYGVAKSLTKISGAFLIFQFALIGAHQYTINFQWIPEIKKSSFYQTVASGTTSGDTDKPDIYFIILDQMGSSRVLKRFFDCDNSEFLNQLRERGFVVTEKSHSNYPKTLLSLTSILNMSYLAPFSTICGSQSNDWSTLFWAVNDTAVVRSLKNNGYRIVQLDSGFPPTNANALADVNERLTHLDDFRIRLLDTTAIGLLPNLESTLEDWQRQHRLAEFKKLEESARLSGPKFVFAHFLLPHEPFLFGQNGEPVHSVELRANGKWAKSTADGYKQQAIFAETKAIEAIDSILKSSEKKPIIILQGDHGSSSSAPVSVSDPSDEFLSERFGILNAYLVPDKIKGSLYETITPVNSFRIILNEVLGTKLDKLPDRIFFTPYPYPFKFQDVTENTLDADNTVFGEY